MGSTRRCPPLRLWAVPHRLTTVPPFQASHTLVAPEAKQSQFPLHRSPQCCLFYCKSRPTAGWGSGGRGPPSLALCPQIPAELAWPSPQFAGGGFRLPSSPTLGPHTAVRQPGPECLPQRGGGRGYLGLFVHLRFCPDLPERMPLFSPAGVLWGPRGHKLSSGPPPGLSCGTNRAQDLRTRTTRLRTPSARGGQATPRVGGVGSLRKSLRPRVRQ